MSLDRAHILRALPCYLCGDLPSEAAADVRAALEEDPELATLAAQLSASGTLCQDRLRRTAPGSLFVVRRAAAVERPASAIWAGLVAVVFAVSFVLATAGGPDRRAADDVRQLLRADGAVLPRRPVLVADVSGRALGPRHDLARRRGRADQRSVNLGARNGGGELMRAGMTLGGLVVTALFVGGCRPPVAAPEAARGVAVRFRPGATPPPEVARLLERVPNASYDEGLQRAVELLLAAARAPSSRISPEASADALTAAAYPGFAKFSREYNGGAFPEDLAETLRGA